MKHIKKFGELEQKSYKADVNEETSFRWPSPKPNIDADVKNIKIINEDSLGDGQVYIIKMETDKGDFFMQLKKDFLWSEILPKK
jgi:hypothetical protein